MTYFPLDAPPLEMEPMATAHRIRVGRSLGRGAFGSVRHGCNSRGAELAIKFPNHSAGARQLCREVQVLEAQAGNPFAVRLVDARLDGARPYLAMEYCAGGSLAQQVGRLHWSDVARVLRDVALGLRPIHRAGGCHRDLKPQNLLAWCPHGRREWRVMIGDWGLARLGPAQMDEMGARIGTPAYMAPELRVGLPASSVSDSFALGVTALELLTGSRNPVALERANAPDTLKAIIRGLLLHDAARRLTGEQLIASVRDLARTPAPKRASWETVIAVSAGLALALGAIANARA